MVRGAAGREERAERTHVREHAPQRAVAPRTVAPAPGDAVLVNGGGFGEGRRIRANL